MKKCFVGPQEKPSLSCTCKNLRHKDTPVVFKYLSSAEFCTLIFPECKICSVFLFHTNILFSVSQNLSPGSAHFPFPIFPWHCSIAQTRLSSLSSHFSIFFRCHLQQFANDVLCSGMWQELLGLPHISSELRKSSPVGKFCSPAAPAPVIPCQEWSGQAGIPGGMQGCALDLWLAGSWIAPGAAGEIWCLGFGAQAQPIKYPNKPKQGWEYPLRLAGSKYPQIWGFWQDETSEFAFIYLIWSLFSHFYLFDLF